MTVVGVLGSSGFVGSAVAGALVERGAHVRRVMAPRLRTSARTVDQLLAERTGEHEAALHAELAGTDVVVNAAGVADATAAGEDALFGANALLPLVISRVLARHASSTRLVHVSSAAVQGRTSRLDESRTVAPFSPYSRAKALGEQVLLDRPGTIVFRPTSVHGAERPVTRRLAAVLGSGWASVAGDGRRPTPQVLLPNVGDAIAFTALADDPAPIVLQPHEGLTTGELVRLLGRREPRHVPVALARGAVAALMGAGRWSGLTAATGRRLELMWFGQDQSSGWLERAGWQPPVGIDGWKELA